MLVRLEPAVPDLAGVFDPGAPPGFEPVADQSGGLLDIRVIGLMRNAEPGIGLQPIGQIAEQFERNPVRRVGCILDPGAIGPGPLPRLIRVLKVHEPQAGDPPPSVQKAGIPGVGAHGLGIEAWQQHLDVPYRVGRVGCLQPQDETVHAGGNLDHHPTRRPLDNRTARKLDLPLTLPEHRVAPARTPAARVGVKRRLGEAAGLQVIDPAPIIQHQRRALAPGCSCALADPGPRQPEYIGER